MGVHVHVAADIFLANQLGKSTLRSGVDLAEVLAELGRDPCEVEGGVDLLFCRGGDYGVIVEAGQRPLAERVAHLEGALAEGDVVVLGSGEVLERRAVGG
jgi:hypothetical protein